MLSKCVIKREKVKAKKRGMKNSQVRNETKEPTNNVVSVWKFCTRSRTYKCSLHFLCIIRNAGASIS